MASRKATTWREHRFCLAAELVAYTGHAVGCDVPLEPPAHVVGVDPRLRIGSVKSKVWRSSSSSPTVSRPFSATAPVLRHYLKDVPIVRRYFDVDVDAPLEEFAAVVPQHPVFRIEED